MAGIKFGRIPFSPLEWQQKDRANAMEMLVNYETGDIYITDKDRNFIDVTSQIRSQLQNLSGDTMTIDIPGIGNVKMLATVEEIISLLDNSINVTDVGSSSFDYNEQKGSIDKLSIENKNDKIQVAGFDVALNNTIFTKDKNGLPKWLDLADIVQNGDPGNMDPENPTDGKSTKVDVIEATSERIYLRIDRYQKTVNPQQNQLQVILPTIVDDYGKVEWLLQLYDNIPSFAFSNNIVWEFKNNYQPENPNNFYKYSFETYDAGQTWLARYTTFNKDFNDSTDAQNVKQLYLTENYYTKDQIDKAINWGNL